MDTKQQVLGELLRQSGTPVSGQELADRLGLSRTAVWKAVAQLQKDGYSIEALPRRGYTLAQGQDVLTAEETAQYRVSGAPVVVEKVLVSTNLTAKELAAKGAESGTVVIAHAQTGGRGRRGRSFSSPPGTGLYLSVILRSGLSMQAAAQVTSASAVAVCRVFSRLYGKELSIKWVNDLYTPQGKKCCGILTEAAADMESGGVDYLVVGIGCNLYEPEGGFPEELRDVAGAVFERGEPVCRARLAAAIADEVLALCQSLPDVSFMQEYRARNLVPGRDIWILQNGERRPAHAVSITDEGHLTVQTEQGIEEISFGEVSVRFETGK